MQCRAGDVGGVAFWTAALTSGQTDRGDVCSAFLNPWSTKSKRRMSLIMAFGSSSDVILPRCVALHSKVIGIDRSSPPASAAVGTLGISEGQAAGILDYARCRTVRTIKIRMTAPMKPAIK